MKKKKKLKKISSLREQIIKHQDKIEKYEGKDYTVIEYWEKEIRRMESEVKDEEDRLDKS